MGKYGRGSHRMGSLPRDIGVALPLLLWPQVVCFRGKSHCQGRVTNHRKSHTRAGRNPCQRLYLLHPRAMLALSSAQKRVNTEGSWKARADAEYFFHWRAVSRQGSFSGAPSQSEAFGSQEEIDVRQHEDTIVV